MDGSDHLQRDAAREPRTGGIEQRSGTGDRRGRWGPGWIVAAAFIGPGTVTTASVAGVRFGVALLWALLFGTLATMALQERAARLGLVTAVAFGLLWTGCYRVVERALAGAGIR